MSPSRYIFYPEAVREAQEAREWYRARSEDAAQGFLSELSEAFQLIAANPDAWQAHPTGDRRFVMRRYPYLVAYRVFGDRIAVVAVAHQRRKPGYWKGR